MRLIDDAKWVWSKAWSVKLTILAAFLTGVETYNGAVLALSLKPPFPPGIFALAAGLVACAALAARFVAQAKD
jgi:hypothetical protein